LGDVLGRKRVAELERAASFPESEAAKSSEALPATVAKKRSRSQLDQLIRKREKTRLEKFLAGPFDSVVGVLIVINAMMLFMDLEGHGRELSAALDLTPYDPFWEDAGKVFGVLEHCFNALFLAELSLRLGVLRVRFFYDPDLRRFDMFNIFDLFVVALCTIDLWVLPAFQGSAQGNLTFCRLVRLIRLSRGFKVIRVMKAFSKLRILLRTVAASFMALFWSMVLLTILNFGGAIFLCQLLQPTIADGDLDFELRLWVFQYYGTAGRALWTMFEFTHSGGWPNYARRIIEEVHWSYAIFYALYVSMVVFAVIRIITALFLRDTLQVAASDADMIIQESLQKTKKYVARLEQLFQLADTSGDGRVTFEELERICRVPEVRMYMQMLELDFYEVRGLFDLLDSGRGSVSLAEFIAGIMRLKGQARSMDIIAIGTSCDKIYGRCSSIEQRVKELHGMSGPEQEMQPIEGAEQQLKAVKEENDADALNSVQL